MEKYDSENNITETPDANKINEEKTHENQHNFSRSIGQQTLATLNERTTAPIAKGNTMPPYCGKAVTWRLIQYA